MTGSGSAQRNTRDDARGGKFPTSWNSSTVLLPSVLVFLFFVLLALTRTPEQGDTDVYVSDIISRLRGEPGTFWEFGHPVWRPVGYILFRLLHPGGLPGDEVQLHLFVVGILTALSVVGGGVVVLSCFAWLERLGVARFASIPVTLLMAMSSAILGYSQTGSSYVPALAMLLVGLYVMAAPDDESLTRTVVAASFAFAASVLFWVPIVLGVPAAALSTLLLRGDSPRRRRIAIAVCLLSGAITILAYVPITLAAGIRSIDGLKSWMQAASHGIHGPGGPARMLMGFGRSLVSMEGLGLVAKRMMLHDPYNPATWSDVVRAGLGRLAISYVVLGALIVAALRRPFGRRAIALLLAASLPVLGFAWSWQAGDQERYLALYPMLFLVLALGLSSLPSRTSRLAGPALVLAMLMLNVPPLSRAGATQYCEALAARLASVPRTDGRPVIILTPHELDPISTFRNRCPDSPLLREANAPRSYGLVMANNSTAPQWRSAVRARAERAWQKSGHLWISRRAFDPAPSRDSKWAEGDDPVLHWNDFPAFFSRMDVGPPTGGSDGFVELLPTSRTKLVLEAVAEPASSAPQ